MRLQYLVLAVFVAGCNAEAANQLVDKIVQNWINWVSDFFTADQDKTMLFYLLDRIQGNDSMSTLATESLIKAKSLLNLPQMAQMAAIWKCLHEELGAAGYQETIEILAKQLNNALGKYRLATLALFTADDSSKNSTAVDRNSNTTVTGAIDPGTVAQLEAINATFTKPLVAKTIAYVRQGYTVDQWAAELKCTSDLIKIDQYVKA